MTEVLLACAPGNGIELCKAASELGFTMGNTCSVRKYTEGSVQVWNSTYAGSDDLEKHGTFHTLLGKRATADGYKTEQFEVFTLRSVPLGATP